MDAYIELHHQGAWRRAARVHALDDEHCRVDYETDYLFGKSPEPISLAMPLHFDPYTAFLDDAVGAMRKDTTPAFIYDLVPQGKGRKHLLGLLNLVDHERLITPLVLNGAFNPIGRIRLTTAMAFYRKQEKRETTRQYLQGFTLEDIQLRSEAFLDHLSVHAMLAAGTTGVQGVAPKFLLTTNHEGRWFADMALDDADAAEHWLIKGPRGKSDDDRAVLRNEAAYLRVAKRMGLRTHGEPRLEGELLFVKRFDRRVDENGVTRLHQESVASVAGLRGFAPGTHHIELLTAVREHASDPLQESIEYLLRDVLNVAMRNTDNHARNTAMQILPDGQVQLTPLYDFAPMFMDPEVIPRAVHWRDGAGNRVDDYRQIVEMLPLPYDEQVAIAQRLKAFGAELERLPDICKDEGVEAPVLAQCLARMEETARQLQQIAVPAAPAMQPVERDAKRALTPARPKRGTRS